MLWQSRIEKGNDSRGGVQRKKKYEAGVARQTSWSSRVFSGPQRWPAYYYYGTRAASVVELSLDGVTGDEKRQNGKATHHAKTPRAPQGWGKVQGKVRIPGNIWEYEWSVFRGWDVDGWWQKQSCKGTMVNGAAELNYGGSLSLNVNAGCFSGCLHDIQ